MPVRAAYPVAMAKAAVARYAPPAVELVVVGGLVAAVLLLGPMAAGVKPHHDLPDAYGYGWPQVVLTIAAGLCALAYRWRIDVAFWLSVATATLAQAGPWLTPAGPAMAYLAFRLGSRSERRVTLTWAGLATAALVAGTIVGNAAGLAPLSRLTEGPLWLWIGAAVGLARRSHVRMVQALQERAERAEAAQEEVALRLVAEDRVRIARELHDVLAHHVSVINVQAGVARHLLRQDPEAAQIALGHIRTAAATVLSELQSILGVLRQNESLQPSRPEPTPLDLADTIDAARTLGVDLTVTGPTGMSRLAPLARHAAHRFVQEALTNAGKHAGGAPVSVTITAGDRLRIQVRNPVPDAPRVTTGFGLIGMRERLVAAGGNLSVTTDDGEFSVTAELPLQEVGERE